MFESLKKDNFTRIAVIALIIFTIWWAALFVSKMTEGNNNLLFGALYGTSMAGLGGIVGINGAKYWGGIKSKIGQAMIFLSWGLFAQFLGQFVFSFYNIALHIEIPYPSIADIGFFGAIPLYMLGIFKLAHASGVQFRLRSFITQIQSVAIPTIMILISYILFLREYDFSNVGVLTILLDFGYPIGQGLFVSMAILTYSLSYKLLGGVMRSRILLIVLAFIGQYVADFNFLYQNITGSWYNGGYGDYLYLIAYFLMAIGLFQLRAIGIMLNNRSNIPK